MELALLTGIKRTPFEPTIAVIECPIVQREGEGRSIVAVQLNWQSIPTSESITGTIVAPVVLVTRVLPNQLCAGGRRGGGCLPARAWLWAGAAVMLDE